MEPEEKTNATYEQATGFINTLRTMIAHENTLMNQRLTWMWTLHALLFSAMAFFWNISWMLLSVIVLTGISSCITIGYTLKRGISAINALLQIDKQFKKSLPKNLGLALPVIGSIPLPPVIGARSKAIEWLLPSISMPWILGLAWIALLVLRIAGVGL